VVWRNRFPTERTSSMGLPPRRKGRSRARGRPRPFLRSGKCDKFCTFWCGSLHPRSRGCPVRVDRILGEAETAGKRRVSAEVTLWGRNVNCWHGKALTAGNGALVNWCAVWRRSWALNRIRYTNQPSAVTWIDLALIEAHRDLTRGLMALSASSGSAPGSDRSSRR